ncbi:hypothetical protein OC834_000003 [Tilletia horrida]|nr:hypothetical protein OC834_000003 [Tilletia horrida]
MTSVSSTLARTSFFEMTVKVPFLSREPVQGRPNLFRFRTFLVPENGIKVPAAVIGYWPSPPPDGTCALIVATCAFDARSDVAELITSRDEAEVAYGQVTDPDYVERNQTGATLRGRGRGLCTAQSQTEFSLTGYTYVNGILRQWNLKVYIPRASPRWAKFVAPKVGEVVGVRGRIESFETEPKHLIVMTMESYSAPDPPQASVSAPTASTSANLDDEWLAARQRSIARQRAEREEQDADVRADASSSVDGPAEDNGDAAADSSSGSEEKARKKRRVA